MAGQEFNRYLERAGCANFAGCVGIQDPAHAAEARISIEDGLYLARAGGRIGEDSQCSVTVYAGSLVRFLTRRWTNASAPGPGALYVFDRAILDRGELLSYDAIVLGMELSPVQQLTEHIVGLGNKEHDGTVRVTRPVAPVENARGLITTCPVKNGKNHKKA
ncbi:MAG: hypothetical protein OXR66_09620 [Candidatus Woesearchaeota archaeon]|nr:hypothetical protein [Candidatus Woesearchaeota archaeon]